MDFSEIRQKAIVRWENLTSGEATVIYLGSATCGRAAGIQAVAEKVKTCLEKFNLNAKNKGIVGVLKEIEESSKFRFFYIREQVNVERIVSIKANQATIEDILEELFKSQGINFQLMEDFLILLSPENITYIKTNNHQQQKSITGTITNEFNQPLPGVTIYIKGTSQGTVSDLNGNHNLKVRREEADL